MTTYEQAKAKRDELVAAHERFITNLSSAIPERVRKAMLRSYDKHFVVVRHPDGNYGLAVECADGELLYR